MAHIDMNTEAELREKRDKKAIPHLQQYAPVWLVNEEVMAEDEAVQFNVLFVHPHAGQNNRASWVNRRYRYDAYNNVLYHKGQTTVDEDDAVEMTADEEPYVTAITSDTVNSYGG